MLDLWLPTTDGRWLVVPRYSEPEAEQVILLHKLKLRLPLQPPPRIQAPTSNSIRRGAPVCGADFLSASAENKTLSSVFSSLLRKFGQLRAVGEKEAGARVVDASLSVSIAAIPSCLIISALARPVSSPVCGVRMISPSWVRSKWRNSLAMARASNSSPVEGPIPSQAVGGS